MYLLDTNVVSALAPSKQERPAGLSGWLEAVSDDQVYLSVITVAEIRDGIAKAKRLGATAKATSLAAWWTLVEHAYGARILSFDMSAAIVAGDLIDRARREGVAPGFADVAIAAIATVHGFTVVTRNRRHFMPMLGGIFDPFDAA